MGTTVSPQYGKLNFKKEKQNDKPQYLGILSISHKLWIKAQEFENAGLHIYDKLQISESKAGMRLSGLYMSMWRQIHLRCPISLPIYTVEPLGKSCSSYSKSSGFSFGRCLAIKYHHLVPYFDVESRWEWDIATETHNFFEVIPPNNKIKITGAFREHWVLLSLVMVLLIAIANNFSGRSRNNRIFRSGNWTIEKLLICK